MKDGAFALVSSKITDGSGIIGYMFRDEWTDSDSGWRIYTGDEDPLFLMEPDCVEKVSLEELIRRFPEISDILDSPAGAQFRRDRQGMIVPAEQQTVDSKAALISALSSVRSGRHVSAAAIIIAAAAVLLLVLAVLHLVR